jgi:multiple sugar transport system permease protein
MPKRGHAPAAVVWYFLPAALVSFVVFLIPLVSVLWTSLERQTPGGGWEFVGLRNFLELPSDPLFLKALGNTTVFTLGSVVLHLLLGLVAALLLNEQIYGRRMFRVIALIPWMFSSVVVAGTWRWLLNSQFGPVNDTLRRLGLPSSIEWLGNVSLAMLSVIVANAWRGFPFVMVMCLAGLQAIPRVQYEAAAVDGAGAWHRFWFITLPNLRFVLTIAAILDVIWNFKYFDLVMIMTNGGPASSTEVVVTLVFRNAFEFFRVGYAAAQAVIVFLILAVFSGIYVRLLRV